MKKPLKNMKLIHGKKGEPFTDQTDGGGRDDVNEGKRKSEVRWPL